MQKMNRRKFIQMSGYGALGTMLPYNTYCTPNMNPLLWGTIFRKGAQILFTAVAEEAVKRTYDYFFGSKKEEPNGCYHVYNEIVTNMSKQGYSPIASGVPDVYYQIPSSGSPIQTTSKINEVKTSSGIDEYMAFTFAKKENGNVVDTQTAFMVKDIESAAIVTMIPEVLLVALIHEAIKLNETKIYTSKQIQELLLPYKMEEGATAIDGTFHTSYTTKHGSVSLINGKIDRDRNNYNLPAFISGRLEITPIKETDDKNNYFAQSRRDPWENEDISYLFR
jgi:hypothetical protein